MSDTADLFADRWLRGQPVYLTDLEHCTPAAALHRGSRARHWRLLPYSLDGLTGTMLRADPETDPPDVSYRLDRPGQHAISIGMMAESEGDASALVRLSSDATFTPITCPAVSRKGRGQIRELYWKVADLTSQELIVAQPRAQIASGEAPGCVVGPQVRIAYFKLVPLSAGEALIYQADREAADTRRLFGHNDAHGLHYRSRPITAEGVQRHIEMFRDTDFSRLYWECGMGDLLYYLGNAGRLCTFPGLDDFPQRGARLHRESWSILQQRGIDPFRVALEHAHDIGLELHASYRPAGFKFPPAHDHFDHGDSFYERHPQLRGRDRQGNPTPRVSYTFAETRQFAIGLLGEVVANYDVDGVALLYNRRPPYAEFEPPLVEGFLREHGSDPRTLADDDPSWLHYRCGVLTGFMRELRVALDAQARRQRRRRVEVSAIVMRDAAENRYYGMDLATWISEGLVDTLIPYTSAEFLDSTADSWVDPHGADYFVGLTAGSSCRLSMSMLPRQMSAELYRERVARLYGVGVDSFFFWDCTPDRGNYTDSWSALRRLGHRDEVTKWAAAGRPALTLAPRPLTAIDGWDLAYATPG